MEAVAADICSTDTSTLRAFIATLMAKCKSKPAGVDGALHDAHQEFHRLIEPK